MLSILESFARKQLNVKYIPESLPKPDNKSFDFIKSPHFTLKIVSFFAF
jgi:hypothetical protein